MSTKENDPYRIKVQSAEFHAEAAKVLLGKYADLDEQYITFLVDLSNVQAMDSGALREIFSFQARLEPEGQVFLCCENSDLMEALRLMGVPEVLPVFHSAAQVMQHLKKSQPQSVVEEAKVHTPNIS